MNEFPRRRSCSSLRHPEAARRMLERMGPHGPDSGVVARIVGTPPTYLAGDCRLLQHPLVQ
jgi:hypothetical protein